MKSVDEVVALAFEAARGLRRRGEDEAALASLGMHASRTVSAGPFLAIDRDLAKRAREALTEARETALALRVQLWAADSQGASAKGGAAAAYLRGRAWAEGGAKRAELGWIRDVPREAALRSIIVDRLILHAEARGGAGRAFAVAALEAELAERPAPDTFGRILEAASLAGTAEAIARTQEGVGMGMSGGATPDALHDGERLAVGLAVERMRVEGAALKDAAARVAEEKNTATAVRGSMLVHLAGRLAAAGEKEVAMAVLDSARLELERAKPVPVGWITAAYAIPFFMVASAPVNPFKDAARTPVDPADLTFGAAAASRALGDARPALAALAMFDPEDHLALVSKDKGAPLVTMLVREAARHASVRGDLAELEQALAAIRRFGTRPAWEAYLRAIVADGAAHLAAWHRSDDAWEVVAGAAATRRLSRFERAKIIGRAACEFVRATEVAPREPPWAGLLFGGPPRPPPAETQSLQGR